MKSPPANGLLLTITSDMPNLQQLDLTNQGGFYPNVINAALDGLTIMIQQLKEGFRSAFRGSIVEEDVNSEDFINDLKSIANDVANNSANIAEQAQTALEASNASAENAQRALEILNTLESIATGINLRGIVLSAQTAMPTHSVSALTVESGGSGYALGDVVYISLSGVTEIPAWAIVSAIDTGGAITTLEIVNPGAFTDVSDTSGLLIEFGQTAGSGATMTVTFMDGMGDTLYAIPNTRKGDAAVVLHSETTGGVAWMWLYADQNGDGIYNWIPAGGPMGAQRNFILDPIK
jgi:hypothetical protein